MSKIIMDNQAEGLSDLQALDYVKTVIKMGRVSNNETQYAYHVSFEFYDNHEIHVQAYLNKKSDRFVVFKLPKPKTGNRNDIIL
jgi:hypothetical protein